MQRPVRLEPATAYQLINARRNRGGIAARERKLGRNIKVKSQFRVEAGDFVVSKRQIVHGACGIVPPDLSGAVVSNEYLVLQPIDGLELDYLRYLPHLPYFQRTVFHSSIGVDVEKMVFKEGQWMKFRLPVPPPFEQRKIASILSSVGEVVEKTEAAIAQLQVVKGAMMQDLLTRGLPGRHTRFKLTAIGEIPEEWDLVELDKCIVPGRPICYGILKPGRGHPGGVPVVKVKDIREGRIFENDLLLTTPELDEQYRRSRLHAGDVLLTIRGTTGRVGVVPMSLDGANITQDTARLSLSRDISTNYLLSVLESPALQAQIRNHTKGQAVQGINIRDVRELLLPLPSREEQDLIAAGFQAVRWWQQTETEKLSAVRQLWSSLMSALLTGEVRVPLDEEAA